MRLRLIIFLTIFLAISTVYVLSPVTQGFAMSTMYLIFPVVAASIGLYSTKLYGFNSTSGRVLLPIAYGLSCWALGEIIWYILKSLMNTEPFPSLGDVFFLLGYPVIGVGIYQFYRKAGVKLKLVNKSLLIPTVLTSIILIILVAYFGIYQPYDPNTYLLANIVTISYGLGDIILIISSLLAVLVANKYLGGKLAFLWRAIIPGFITYLIADILFALYSKSYADDIKPYAYIDLIWIAGYMIIAFGILEYIINTYTVQKKIQLKLRQIE